MSIERKSVSPLLYYVLLSGLTNLTFVIGGVAVLAFDSLRIIDNFAFIVITVLLLWKGFIIGLLTWLFLGKLHNHEFAVKFIGQYHGRLFGLLIGGFLGLRIANMLALSGITGVMVGALALYFVGRWIGPKVSNAVDGRLDKLFSRTDTRTTERVVQVRSSYRIILVLFIVIFPWSFVILGWLMNYLDIQVGFLNEWLPISRILIIALAIFSIGYPWLVRKRLLIKYKSTTTSPVLMSSWMGLSLSVAPAAYGFLLYVGMGASFIELCCFTAASSLAAFIWIANNPILKVQKAV